MSPYIQLSITVLRANVSIKMTEMSMVMYDEMCEAVVEAYYDKVLCLPFAWLTLQP
jgi:hypothetical protein